MAVKTIKTKRKPKLAMIAMGVIGGGVDGQGIPAVTEMIDEVSRQFDITYYSLQRVNANVLPSIKVKQVLNWRIPGRLKYLLLMFRIIVDHFVDPHSVIYSIAVFPTGRMAIWLGKLLRRPVVVHLLALEAVALENIRYGSLISPALARISKWVCDSADEVIVLSHFQNKIARQNLPTKRDFTVIPLSVNLRKFQYHKRNILDPVRFIHVAYYHPVKDQLTLFRAFALIASEVNCELKVIGSGFEIEVIHALLGELGISEKVFFTGQVRNDELRFYFRDAHILLHTSLYESETIVALEAMASGIPVCSTRVGIMDDLGEDFFVLAPVGDAHQLAEKVIALVRDPAHYSALQQKAYEWVVAHDSQWSARAYADVFTKWLRY